MSNICKLFPRQFSRGGIQEGFRPSCTPLVTPLLVTMEVALRWWHTSAGVVYFASFLQITAWQLVVITKYIQVYFGVSRLYVNLKQSWLSPESDITLCWTLLLPSFSGCLFILYHAWRFPMFGYLPAAYVPICFMTLLTKSLVALCDQADRVFGTVR